MIKTLLVEDSNFQQKNMTLILEDLGLNVSTSANGKEALSLLENEEFDLLVIDLLMPVMGGLELMKNLRDSHIDKPFIVVTADIQDTTREQCMEFSPKAILHKPLDIKILKNVLGTIFTKGLAYE